MLTQKQDIDGKWYHAEQIWDENRDEFTEESFFILDEHKQKIPIEICLCFAYNPYECCCATTAWDNYTDWDED